MDNLIPIRRRGRPKKSSQQGQEYHETKIALLRAGIEILTEKGFSATGLEEILKSVNVPKGSFYHFFDSKEAFGIALVEFYASYFDHKLDKFLLDESQKPLQRLRNFTNHIKQQMIRHNYQRGCLIGNLGQEMGHLQDSFRQALIDVFYNWQNRFAVCLEQAKQQQEISKNANCIYLASCFWIGWEGAISRSKLEKTLQPLELFEDFFFSNLPR